MKDRTCKRNLVLWQPVKPPTMQQSQKHQHHTLDKPKPHTWLYFNFTDNSTWTEFTFKPISFLQNLPICHCYSIQRETLGHWFTDIRPKQSISRFLSLAVMRPDSWNAASLMPKALSVSRATNQLLSHGSIHKTQPAKWATSIASTCQVTHTLPFHRWWKE